MLDQGFVPRTLPLQEQPETSLAAGDAKVSAQPTLIIAPFIYVGRFLHKSGSSKLTSLWLHRELQSENRNRVRTQSQLLASHLSGSLESFAIVSPFEINDTVAPERVALMLKRKRILPGAFKWISSPSNPTPLAFASCHFSLETNDQWSYAIS